MERPSLVPCLWTGLRAVSFCIRAGIRGFDGIRSFRAFVMTALSILRGDSIFLSLYRLQTGYARAGLLQ